MIINNDAFTQWIAKSDKKREIYIPEKSRYLNTLILGTKNSGKTYEMLPIMAKQDMENKECGATFVVGKKEMAYFLYAMAKQCGRRVVLIKPSASNEAESLLWKEQYDYDYINDNVIDYKNAIKKKMIVIIDMEYIKYKGKSIRATAMLLSQFQLDMQDVGDTLKKPHFVYIDDAQYYVPFIETMLTTGEDYNVGVTLFLQSRNQLKTRSRSYCSLIDNNIRSIILMNGLNILDVEHYQKQFYEHNTNLFINRKHGQIIYETVDSTNTRRNGFADLVLIEDDYREELEEKAVGIRKKLTKRKRKLDLGEANVSSMEDTVGSEEENENEIVIEVASDKEPVIEFQIPVEENKHVKEDKVIKTTPTHKQVAKPQSKHVSKPATKKEPVKKTPKEIVSDDLDKMSGHFEICDTNFDFEDEF